MGFSVRTILLLAAVILFVIGAIGDSPVDWLPWGLAAFAPDPRDAVDAVTIAACLALVLRDDRRVEAEERWGLREDAFGVATEVGAPPKVRRGTGPDGRVAVADLHGLHRRHRGELGPAQRHVPQDLAG